MKKVMTGSPYIIVDAHDRSSPSDPYDKWGNLKVARMRRKRRHRSPRQQVAIPKVY